MHKHNELQLRDATAPPTSRDLEQTLKNSYTAYEAFQKALPGLEIEQEWQWYTPYKAWFARGQHRWTTPRGTKKEKTLYWLHVFDGHFNVAVWFKEKNRIEAINSDVSDKTRQLIIDTNTIGKVPTFPVIVDITETEPLEDIFTLIECKKRLER